MKGYTECPRCNRNVLHREDMVLSRRDNRTIICSDCDTRESMGDYYAQLSKKFYAMHYEEENKQKENIKMH